MDANERKRRIWRVVGAIPPSQVMSYGAVARSAGLNRGARQVAAALQAAPRELSVPWHRVLRADGRIAFPEDSKNYKKQCELLRAEGVVVKNGRVKVNPNDDKSELDKLLWSSAARPL